VKFLLVFARKSNRVTRRISIAKFSWFNY